MSTDNAGTLVLDRTATDDIKMRDLYVRIDDGPELTLQYGETTTQPIASGEHRISVTNRLYSQTERFTVQPNETVRYATINVPKGGVLNALAVITGSVMYRPVLRRL